MYCNSGCKNDNCDYVLKKAHDLFQEADCYFDAAGIEFNQNLLMKIYEALDILRKVGELEDKGVALDEEGRALIENSNCNFPSNKDDPRCKAIYAKAIEQFIGEQNAQDEIERLLKEILNQIKIGAEFDARGEELLEEYKECIHCGRNKYHCRCEDKRYR